MMNFKEPWEGCRRLLPAFLCAHIFIERETSGYEAAENVRCEPHGTCTLIENSMDSPLVCSPLLVFPLLLFTALAWMYKRNIHLSLLFLLRSKQVESFVKNCR